MNVDDYRIDEVWGVLSEKQKIVIESRYFGDKPQNFLEISKRLGVSQSYASLLHKQALKKMREKFSRIDKTDLDSDFCARQPLVWPEAGLPKPLKPVYRYYPEERHIAWANRTIKMLESYKKGKRVQMKGQATCGDWKDFDLTNEIDTERLIEWRAKPEGNTNGNSIS